MSGGYGYETDSFDAVVSNLRGSARGLDEATSKRLGPVDAGASSGAVGNAIAEVLQTAVVVANTMSEAADNVHRAKGSYDQTEGAQVDVLRYYEDGEGGGGNGQGGGR